MEFSLYEWEFLTNISNFQLTKNLVMKVTFNLTNPVKYYKCNSLNNYLKRTNKNTFFKCNRNSQCLYVQGKCTANPWRNVDKTKRGSVYASLSNCSTLFWNQRSLSIFIKFRTNVICHFSKCNNLGTMFTKYDMSLNLTILERCLLNMTCL